MIDLVLRGATVVDGTGRPRVVADVGVHEGRIAFVGDEGEGVGESARRVVDAAGLVVAPGFVDVHTHYDAQAMWDGGVSPSPLHGVTSVMGGNCGFTLAPAGPEHADYLLPLLARVEGIPLESLTAGVEWTWRSTAEYLDRLEGAVAPNVGFLVGHSAIRRVVMGEAAVGETVTPDQLERMAALLDESLSAGALGFSSSNGRAHHDANGDPVPSRWASDEEFVRLSRVVADHPGTSLEYIPYDAVDDRERMTQMSAAGRRPLNWNVLLIAPNRVEAYEAELAVSDFAAERGGRVVALSLPAVTEVRLNFRTGFVLDSFPDWLDIMKLPVPERMVALREPAVRDRLHAGATRVNRAVELADFPRYRFDQTFAAVNDGLAGRLVGDVAAERGADPFDVLLDVVLADELRTVLLTPPIGADEETWKRRAEVWRDPRVVLGASDAGAHLDMLNGFSYPTVVLGEAVRRRELLTLEEAVHLLADRPCRLYGLRGRGRIAPGWAADLVVFDPDRIAAGPLTTRHDLPAGGTRLYGEGLGIEHVLVNGEEIVTGGTYTGARPGTVFRAGRDTDTVLV